jgi:hypothetical protein
MTRRRVRWYHVVVLGVAVLVCAAAIGFFVSQSSDREDATTARHAAESALAEQRDETSGARHDLVTDKAEIKDALGDVEQLTTSVHELTDLTAQEVDSLVALNQLAVSSPSAADQINAQMHHSADLLTQMEAKAQSVLDQANALRDRADDAQLAAAVSNR